MTFPVLDSESDFHCIESTQILGDATFIQENDSSFFPSSVSRVMLTTLAVLSDSASHRYGLCPRHCRRCDVFSQSVDPDTRPPGASSTSSRCRFFKTARTSKLQHVASPALFNPQQLHTFLKFVSLLIPRRPESSSLSLCLFLSLHLTASSIFISDPLYLRLFFSLQLALSIAVSLSVLFLSLCGSLSRCVYRCVNLHLGLYLLCLLSLPSVSPNPNEHNEYNENNEWTFRVCPATIFLFQFILSFCCSMCLRRCACSCTVLC